MNRLVTDNISADIEMTFSLGTLVVVTVDVECPRNFHRLVREQ